jgi:YidC/Oxa1 family membrane protein insertase
MDKRFFLFLILAAAVLIVTPLLFPPSHAPAPRSASTDTTQVSQPSESARAETAAAAPQAVAPAPTPAAEPASPVAATPETVTVRTAKSVYQFSTVGAMPTAITLPGYKSLAREDGAVELARPGTPLVEYALLRGPGDTLHLDRAAFTVDSSKLSSTTAPELTFRATVGGSTIAIAYTFSPDSYTVRVRGTVEGAGAGTHYLLTTIPNGLRSEEADTTADQHQLAYVVKPVRDNPKSIAFGKLDTTAARAENGPFTWIASKNKYFVVGLLTDSTQAPFGGAVFRGLPRVGKIATSASATVVQPIGANGQFAFEMYAGPQEWKRLLAVGRDFDHVNPYGGFFQGIVQPFATIVMRILLWIHERLPINYGWILIIFGIAVRLILWPLNQGAMRSSIKMQRLQPELQALQKKYKNQPEKQHAEMMKLYKEHGMSPFSPLAGCLPMLIPMPVLFALFFVFQNTIEFRGVSFLWLPDISLKDPYYILPIVMGLSMYLLSWIGLRSSPPNAQAKMMAYMMPVMMTVFFLNLASGLNLYYAVQNFAALPQQWLIARERAKVGGTPVVRTTTG